ncbi:G-type lectin S-receptor-like serine/threonine-protein kinase [Quillaja saponaria]|nr:G-type lectin S-receptor-like serine/threonine-protein kinase [Quillaja saponaria]
MGFIGRAFLIETDQMTPNFRVAMSVEAINGKYSCSLQVFLGDVKVWDSGHYSHFYTSDKCILELTLEGDLRLKGPKERVGWKTGTSGQGVERLQLLRTGNLVLVDVLDHIKWQSFHFPTDVMLWGQRLDVATRLTSFLSNSSEFYSFEVQNNKIALYLNSGKLRYSYWEFNPSKNRSINFVELSASGLELFNEKYKKMGQIPSQGLYPLRFLALKNETGNFGLYFYSPDREKFEASFQALNSTCDLPMSCKAYGICTFSSTCACLPLPTKENKGNFSCNSEISGGFCSDKQAEMLELEGVSSVLKDDPKMVNISREACENLCLEDCKCAAALYSSGKEASDIQQCFLYRLVMGLKQVEKGDGFSYMIKVPKGTGGGHGRSSLKKWVLVVVGVVDGLIILLVVGGLGYYFMQKRRKNSSHSDGNTS